MSTPFYVSPQQAMADRAEYARKGIARGRSLVVLQYADGIVFVGENPSRALHKFSEIYDRIGFAAAGKYNEYENLRIGGVRYADLRGYTYDRDDVTARGLANVYAQTLGTIFSSAAEKPYEVELVVAEVGAGARGRPDLPAAARRFDRGRARLGRGRRQRRADQQLPRPAPPRRDVAGRGAEAGRAGAVPRQPTAASGRSPPSGWRSRSWTARGRSSASSSGSWAASWPGCWRRTVPGPPRRTPRPTRRSPKRQHPGRRTAEDIPAKGTGAEAESTDEDPKE